MVLLIVIHASLGDKQNRCAEDKNRAGYVEDRRADAAGGGELGSGVVFDLNRFNAVCVFFGYVDLTVRTNNNLN